MTETLHKFFPGNSRERIQDLLRDRGMSQAELAEKIGMSESSLSRYLSGQTDKLSTDNIVSIARVFEVTTDFLLCLTDIPFTTNYDIEKLGLTVKAAEKLLRRKVNPETVSHLIETQGFNQLILQLDAALRGTYDAGYMFMTEMFKNARNLFSDYAQENPEDRHAAKKVIEDMRGLQAVPRQTELAGIEDAMRQIVAEFRKGTEAYLAETQKLTSEIMRKITGNLRTQMNNPNKLRGITPEMMVDNIIDCLKDTELTEEQKASLKEVLLPLFTRPSDLKEQMKLSDGSEEDKSSISTKK